MMYLFISYNNPISRDTQSKKCSGRAVQGCLAPGARLPCTRSKAALQRCKAALNPEQGCLATFQGSLAPLDRCKLARAHVRLRCHFLIG